MMERDRSDRERCVSCSSLKDVVVFRLTPGLSCALNQHCVWSIRHV